MNGDLQLFQPDECSFQSVSRVLSKHILESQNSLGWKESLEVIWPNTLFKAESARTGCSGPCSVKPEYLQPWRFHNSVDPCPSF